MTMIYTAMIRSSCSITHHLLTRSEDIVVLFVLCQPLQ